MRTETVVDMCIYQEMGSDSSTRILIDELDPTLDMSIYTSLQPNACDPVFMMLRYCQFPYHIKLD